jgi:hypothetical protein
MEEGDSGKAGFRFSEEKPNSSMKHEHEVAGHLMFLFWQVKKVTGVLAASVANENGPLPCHGL